MVIARKNRGLPRFTGTVGHTADIVYGFRGNPPGGRPRRSRYSAFGSAARPCSRVGDTGGAGLVGWKYGSVLSFQKGRRALAKAGSPSLSALAQPLWTGDGVYSCAGTVSPSDEAV